MSLFANKSVAKQAYEQASGAQLPTKLLEVYEATLLFVMIIIKLNNRIL